MNIPLKHSFLKHSLLFFVFSVLFATSCAPKKITTRPEKQHVSKKEARAEVRVPKVSKGSSIVIDPGHGGDDPGAKSIVAPFTREKTYTLKTALKVQEFLSSWGYETHLTRRSDIFIPLLQRVEFAEKNNGRLFVSIHFNSTPKPTKAKGVEIYYFKKQKKDQRAHLSHLLADHILKRMTPITKTAPRGIHVGNFCVIRETSMPAVLVEAGFLSNPEEAQKLKNPNYIRFLAWSIAKGIEDYLKKERIVLGAN